MSKEQSAQKGREFQALRVQLDEVFMTLEQSYMDQFNESSFEDADLREHLYHRIRVMKDFARVIDAVVSSGQISQAEIIRLSKIESGEKREFF